MDLLSTLVESDSLPSELLQQMLTTDGVTTREQQQVVYSCHLNDEVITSV